jgi:hypothetical protein
MKKFKNNILTAILSMVLTLTASYAQQSYVGLRLGINNSDERTYGDNEKF